MILIINSDREECYLLQKTLSKCFSVKCVCFEYFKIEYLLDSNIDILLFNCDKYGKKTLEMFASIMEEYPKITIICLTAERTEKILKTRNVITIPKNNYNLLNRRLREISSESLKESYWTDTIDEVKKYIEDNIKSIKSSEQIAENFNIEHRKLCLEFKQKTGKTIRAYITDIRFIMLTDILKNTTEIGNYYAIARECGLEDDRVMYNIVKKKTGKTPMEFHRQLLNEKSNR